MKNLIPALFGSMNIGLWIHIFAIICEYQCLHKLGMIIFVLMAEFLRQFWYKEIFFSSGIRTKTATAAILKHVRGWFFFLQAAGIRTTAPCNFENLSKLVLVSLLPMYGWLFWPRGVWHVMQICHCILPLFALPLSVLLIPNKLMTDKLDGNKPQIGLNFFLLFYDISLLNCYFI